jgi:hypothetical protein
MHRGPTGRRRFSSTEREKLLAAYRQSELTQREFASRNGISLSCLVLWLRKSNGAQSEGAPAAFIQLPGGFPNPEMGRVAYKIRFSSGHCLEVASGFRPEELSQLCQIVRGL